MVPVARADLISNCSIENWMRTTKKGTYNGSVNTATLTIMNNDETPLTSLDRYDITQAFSYYDVDYEQAIPMADVHEIFLGLGFQPNDITIPQLRDAFIAQQEKKKRQYKQSESVIATKLSSSSHLTLSQVMELFQNVSLNFRSHQRRKEIPATNPHSCFNLCMKQLVST
jgi:hypothetical protein